MLQPVGWFLLKFKTELFLDAVPVVQINGHCETVKILNEYQATCSSSLKSTVSQLCFKTGPESEMVINNPYYCPDETIAFRWQCEGRPEERRILIPRRSFPYATENVSFSFDFFIENRFQGTFTGSLNLDQLVIIIPIESIQKTKCVKKKCVLQGLSQFSCWSPEIISLVITSDLVSFDQIYTLS